MLRSWLALAVALSGSVALGQTPAYTAASIVNASDYSPGPFAPGSLLSIFGTNLSFSPPTGLTADNTSGNKLPTTLGNITVVIDNSAAALLYVSSTQINVMIPSNEVPGNIQLQVVRQGTQGPSVTIALVAGAPALFVSTDRLALAQDYNAKYALVTAAAPAQAGDLLVLYATGLGGTAIQPGLGEIPTYASFINGFTTGALQVLLNGKAVDSKTIPYAGLTPGYAGLYQINFYLPGDCPPNPQIQLAMGAQLSAPKVMLAVAPIPQ
jgi:uncharacterized protein (TIGR03437 family)